MSIELLIRPGKPADAACVLELVGSTPEAPGWPEEVWRGYFYPEASPARVVLLALASGQRICGLLAGTCVADQAEVESLLVIPAFRRQGVGRALLQAWLDWAAGAGAGAALLEVRLSNHAAVALYRSLGFHVQTQRKAYYHDPLEDALLMGLQLAPAKTAFRKG